MYSVASIVCSASASLTNRALLAFASSHILQGPSHRTQVAHERRLHEKDLDRLGDLRNVCTKAMTELELELEYLCDCCTAAVYKAHVSGSRRALLGLGTCDFCRAAMHPFPLQHRTHAQAAGAGWPDGLQSGFS